MPAGITSYLKVKHDQKGSPKWPLFGILSRTSSTKYDIMRKKQIQIGHKI